MLFCGKALWMNNRVKWVHHDDRQWPEEYHFLVNVRGWQMKTSLSVASRETEILPWKLGWHKIEREFYGNGMICFDELWSQTYLFCSQTEKYEWDGIDKWRASHNRIKETIVVSSRWSKTTWYQYKKCNIPKPRT